MTHWHSQLQACLVGLLLAATAPASDLRVWSFGVPGWWSYETAAVGLALQAGSEPLEAELSVSVTTGDVGSNEGGDLTLPEPLTLLREPALRLAPGELATRLVPTRELGYWCLGVRRLQVRLTPRQGPARALTAKGGGNGVLIVDGRQQAAAISRRLDPRWGRPIIDGTVADIPTTMQQWLFSSALIGLQQAQALSEAQVRLLTDFVAGGGRVTLFDNLPANTPAPDLSRLAQLLPLRLGDKRQPLPVTVLEALGGVPAPAAAAGLCRRDFTLPEGRRLSPMIPYLHFARGSGTVRFVGFDLLAPCLLSWPGAPRLWADYLISVSPLRNAQRLPTWQLRNTFSGRGPHLDAAAAWERMSRPTVVLSLGLLLALAGAYALLQRRYRRGACSRRQLLAGTWGAALLAVLLLAAVHRWNAQLPMPCWSQEVSWLYPELQRRETAGLAAFMPRAASRVTLAWRAEPDLQAQDLGGSVWGNYWVPNLGATIPSLDVRGFQWRRLLARRTVACSDFIEAVELRVAPTGRVTGRLRNRTGKDLVSCLLFVHAELPQRQKRKESSYGPLYLSLPDLPAGAEIAVDATATLWSGRDNTRDAQPPLRLNPVQVNVVSGLTQAKDLSSSRSTLSEAPLRFIGFTSPPALTPRFRPQDECLSEVVCWTQFLPCHWESPPDCRPELNGPVDSAGVVWNLGANNSLELRSVYSGTPVTAAEYGFQGHASKGFLLPGTSIILTCSLPPSPFFAPGAAAWPADGLSLSVPVSSEAALPGSTALPVADDASVAVEALDVEAGVWVSLGRVGGARAMPKLDDATLRARLQTVRQQRMAAAARGSPPPAGMFGGAARDVEPSAELADDVVALPQPQRFITSPELKFYLRLRHTGSGGGSYQITSGDIRLNYPVSEQQGGNP